MSSPAADETTCENPRPEVSVRPSPDRSGSTGGDAAMSSELLVTAAAVDDHVPTTTPDESAIIEDWEQLLSVMENSSFGQSDLPSGIVMYDLPDAAADCRVSQQTVDDPMNANPELQIFAVGDSAGIEHENSVDYDSYVLNEQYLIKNLKRPFESEDNVANNKIRPTDVNFNSLTSKIDIILESQIVPNNSDRMESTERDIYNINNEIETKSPCDDIEDYETINLISDSEDSDLSEISESESESESSESNDDSLIDDLVFHKPSDELLDSTLTDFQNECYNIYPHILKYVRFEDQIFQEFESTCNRQQIRETWMTEFNKKDGPSHRFIINREKKWRVICKKLSRRLKESIIVLKLYEKYMEKLKHAKPYVVKKTDGLHIEFYSEKVEHFPSQLKEASEGNFDSTGPSCSNTIEKKHPAPLPSTPIQLSYESLKNLPPSPTLTVQNCLESRDRKAIVLRWNLNINDEEFTEIICYQIFGYQEISSEKPRSCLWQKITEVNALPLPIKCTLSFESLKSGQKHYFAVRALDKYFRMGPFSSIQLIKIN